MRKALAILACCLLAGARSANIGRLDYSPESGQTWTALAIEAVQAEPVELRLESVFDTHTLYFDDVLAAKATDATYPYALRGGMRVLADGAGAVTADSWDMAVAV